MKMKTVLFDFDGTLIDTNNLILNSFKYTFDYYGYNFTEEEILTFNGPPLIETFSKINKEKAEDMIQTYRQHNHEHHEQYVTLFPNVIETLETLKAKNIRLGIVTAKMRDGVEHGMKITKLEPYFDTIVTIDDVTNPKPHPEPVIKALQSLQADKESAIMVGDNYHDIEAGNRAGVQTVGVNWSVKGAEYLRQFNPTYMIDDMTDLFEIVGVS